MTQIPGSFDPPTSEESSATVQRSKEGQRRRAIQSMQTIDKETERLIRRIERGARAAKRPVEIPALTNSRHNRELSLGA